MGFKTAIAVLRSHYFWPVGNPPRHLTFRRLSCIADLLLLTRGLGFAFLMVISHLYKVEDLCMGAAPNSETISSIHSRTLSSPDRKICSLPHV
jgi:hypothetical protein